MENKSSLDLIFCCDCTGSMGEYILQAKDNIRKISEKIHSLETQDCQYGLICYRDHPPQDNSYNTKTFPLTKSISQMQEHINTMEAQGGGDGPESVACALREVLNMEYRKGSVRVCVLISDAPPHGIGESGDGFPNGCPCGNDPIEIAHEMVSKEIVIYAVAVEPVISTFKHAKAFYKGISEITHGRYLELRDAHLLADVIVGGSVEELDLKKFEEQVLKEEIEVRKNYSNYSEDKIQELVLTNLQSKGVSTWQLEVSSQPSVVANYDCFSNAKSLSKANESLKSRKPTNSTREKSYEKPSKKSSEKLSKKSSEKLSKKSYEKEKKSSRKEYSKCEKLDEKSTSIDEISSLFLENNNNNNNNNNKQQAQYQQQPISMGQVQKIMQKKSSMK